MKEVLRKIKVLRSIRGYSYENMAEELNISTSAYRKIEKNETKLTTQTNSAGVKKQLDSF